MNEFQNRTAGKAFTDDPLESVVSTEALADYLRADEDDPVLNSIGKQATSMVIEFLGYDLTPRDWNLTHWDWPVIGTKTSPTLSGQQGYYRREIRLPYGRVLSVHKVEIYGEEEDGFTKREDSIVLPDAAIRREPGEVPAIYVEYSAGFDPVPDTIKESALQLAAFIYQNRGCALADALTQSGARQALQPWRNPAVVVL